MDPRFYYAHNAFRANDRNRRCHVCEQQRVIGGDGFLPARCMGCGFTQDWFEPIDLGIGKFFSWLMARCKRTWMRLNEKQRAPIVHGLPIGDGIQ